MSDVFSRKKHFFYFFYKYYEKILVSNIKIQKKYKIELIKMIKNYSLSSSNAKQWLRKHLWHPLLLVAVVFAGGFLLALFVAVFVTVGAIAFRHCFLFSLLVCSLLWMLVVLLSLLL